MQPEILEDVPDRAPDSQTASKGSSPALSPGLSPQSPRHRFKDAPGEMEPPPYEGPKHDIEGAPPRLAWGPACS